MMRIARPVLIFFALLSVFWFPWPLSMLLTLIAAFVSPLAPLATGLLAQALYGAPPASVFPLYAVLGGMGSLLAFFVHRFVETSIIKR